MEIKLRTERDCHDPDSSYVSVYYSLQSAKVAELREVLQSSNQQLRSSSYELEAVGHFYILLDRVLKLCKQEKEMISIAPEFELSIKVNRFISLIADYSRRIETALNEVRLNSILNREVNTQASRNLDLLINQLSILLDSLRILFKAIAHEANRAFIS
jgi:hypothetical protein